MLSASPRRSPFGPLAGRGYPARPRPRLPWLMRNPGYDAWLNSGSAPSPPTCPTSVAVDLALRAAVVAEPWPRLHAARVWDRSEGPRAATAPLRRASLIAAWSAAGSGFLGRPWTRTVPRPGLGGCGPPPRPGERRVSVRPSISRGRGNRRATHAGVRKWACQIGSKRACGIHRRATDWAGQQAREGHVCPHCNRRQGTDVLSAGRGTQDGTDQPQRQKGLDKESLSAGEASVGQRGTKGSHGSECCAQQKTGRRRAAYLGQNVAGYASPLEVLTQSKRDADHRVEVALRTRRP